MQQNGKIKKTDADKTYRHVLAASTLEGTASELGGRRPR